ncbi:MAG: hypothetical protein MI741_12205, partial [Rhodospirillales bacterium]|nr:hypothetical protein [Rhodospirillales bacterium]
IILSNNDQSLIHHVGEIALLTLLGPSDTQTTAEVWNNVAATSTDDFRLKFVQSGNVMGGTNYKLTHAGFLLDRLTTLNSEDAIGSAELAGTLNLNTAPYHVLARVLPIADSALRETIARQIITYRDRYDPIAYAAVNRTGTSREEPGIASHAELFNGAEALFDSLFAPATAVAYTGDTRTITHAGGDVIIDFIGEDPDNNGTFLDNTVDDVEERVMLVSKLAQMTSTRTDYVAAHITIHGYESGNFAGGNVDPGQYIVILSRASLTSPDAEVEVLGVYAY